MSSFYPAQASFDRGEISPLLRSRADVDFWRRALAECRNFQVLTHGGIRRRSGTKYVTGLRDPLLPGRLLPFKFSEAQAYILVFSDNHIRFIANRGVVESGGSTYEVAHPWTDAAVTELTYAQANDIGYFAHKDYGPRKLSRASETSWTLEASTFKDGPYLPPDTQGTVLTPASYANPIPKMTSNTTPSGIVSSSPVSADAYKVFNGALTDFVRFNGRSGIIEYQFASGTKVVDAYWMRSSSDGASVPEATPSAWFLEGYDGVNWIIIDTRSGEVGWGSGETRFYEIANKFAYSRYRFRWTANGGSAGVDTDIGEIGLHESGDTQTPFTLTASSTAGINGGNGFQASDVGRSIRLLGSDGAWRWARIAAWSSTTVVTIRLYGHALPDLSPIAQWRMGSWSNESGWPAVVELFNERLMYARTNAEPVSVWGSKQGTFDDFGVSTPVVETDGLSLTLLSSNMNEITGMSADEDLLTFSAGQVRSVGPADITQSFSATNVTQRKGPTNGAASLPPLSVGGVTLYVGGGGTKIRELVIGDQNRYVAPELSLIGEHFLKEGIVSWAFAEKPEPTIYAATGDGLLVAITYDREQKVVGFARHDVGGDVESVAVIPSQSAGYDDVYLIVKRTIGAQTVRYVEVLEKPFDGDTQDVAEAYHVDCGLSYDGTAITTVTGLGHLEGEEVSVLADGGVVNGLVVAGGEITLPYAASKIHVGLSFTSRAVTLPVAGPGRDGTLFGRRTNVVGCHVDVMDTGALSVGPLGGETWSPAPEEQILKTGDTLFGNPVSLVSGFQRCEIEGSWADGEGQVVMETSKPLPALVRSMMFQIESEP